MVFSGLTFLNTRDAAGAAKLTRLLEAQGGRVVAQPCIAFAAPQDWTPFDQAAQGLRAGGWVAFASVNAVAFTLQRLNELGLSQRLAQARLAAVGQATAQALKAAGLRPSLVPGHFQAEELLEELLRALKPGEPVWLPRAAQGREVLAEGLAAAGHPVAATPAYRTIAPPEGMAPPVAQALAAGQVDWLVFTSPSTVTNLLAITPPELRAKLKGHWPPCACLGAVTAQKAAELGFVVGVAPRQQDLPGLVEALARLLSGKKPVNPSKERE